MLCLSFAASATKPGDDLVVLYAACRGSRGVRLVAQVVLTGAVLYTDQERTALQILGVGIVLVVRLAHNAALRHRCSFLVVWYTWPGADRAANLRCRLCPRRAPRAQCQPYNIDVTSL